MWGRLALGMIALGIALGAEARTAPVPQQADVIDAVYRVDGVGRTQVVFELPRGPRTITSIEWQPAGGTSETVWRSARLRLVWDDVDPEAAGVDLPLGRFFELEDPRAADAAHADDEARVAETPHARGDAATSDPPALRNDARMPYRSQGRLILDSAGRLNGTFRIRSELSRTDLEGLGYYRAALELEASKPAEAEPNQADPQPSGRASPKEFETLRARVWYDPKPGPRPDHEDAADGPANPL